MSRKALFAGSFDPVTNGHLAIIQKASQLFDEVVVAVSVNVTKKTLLTASERVMLLEQLLEGNKKVSIITYSDELTVTVAKRIGATHLVRGVRNAQDFVYEQTLAGLNKSQADIETVLLLTDMEQQFISSSAVKELVHFGGDITAFVPSVVKEFLGGK